MRRVRRLVESVKSSWFTMKKKLETKKRNKLTVADIKNAIHNGYTYPASMSKFLKRSRQYVAKFCRELCEQDELEIDVKEGKGKVAIYYKTVKPHWKPTSVRDYLLETKHGLQYFSDDCYISYGIIEYDKHFQPEKEWNWGKNNDKMIRINDCVIKITNDKTIKFHFPKVYGKTPQLAFANMMIRTVDVRKKFMQKYPGFRLTPLPTKESMGNLGTTKLKKTIKHLNPHLPIKTDDWIIDKTPEEGSFEMRVKDDPLKTAEKLQKTVDTIIHYPDRFEKMERLLEMVTVAFTKLVEFEMMKQKPDIQKYEGMVNKLPEVKEILDMMNKKKKKKEKLSYVG